MSGVRGVPQRRPSVPRENPQELVALMVRIPDHLRAKARTAAAAAGVSMAVFIEQWLEHLVVPEAAQEPLPLAESA